MTQRDTKKRRLERAGYHFASGWFPIAYANRVNEQAEMHREDVARILGGPPRPVGRPPKTRKAAEPVMPVGRPKKAKGN